MRETPQLPACEQTTLSGSAQVQDHPGCWVQAVLPVALQASNSTPPATPAPRPGLAPAPQVLCPGGAL